MAKLQNKPYGLLFLEAEWSIDKGHPEYHLNIIAAMAFVLALKCLTYMA